jgi:hypothetical protein
MYSEAEYNQAARTRHYKVVAVLTVSVGLVFAYFGLALLLTDRDAVRAWPEWKQCLLVAPVFPAFLIPTCVGLWWAERTKLPCPACGADIADTRATPARVRFTCCCHKCGIQVLQGGSVRSAAEFSARAQAVRAKNFPRAMWVGPFAGLLTFVALCVDPTLIAACREKAFTIPVLTLVLGLYIWIRSRDARYAWPTLASAAVLGLLVWQFVESA